MSSELLLVQAVVQKGLITAAEIEQAIVTEFNPTRIAFKGSRDIWVNDVLNIGVSPRQGSLPFKETPRLGRLTSC